MCTDLSANSWVTEGGPKTIGMTPIPFSTSVTLATTTLEMVCRREEEGELFS